MNFDFSWFTTIPGIFITAGVVLLIIALIILIVTGKKSKKQRKAMEEANNSQQNDMAGFPATMTPPDMSAVNNQMAGVNQMSQGVSPDVNMVNPTMAQPQPMVNNMVNPNAMMPSVDPMNPVGGMPQPMVGDNNSMAMPEMVGAQPQVMVPDQGMVSPQMPEPIVDNSMMNMGGASIFPDPSVNPQMSTNMQVDVQQPVIPMQSDIQQPVIPMQADVQSVPTIDSSVNVQPQVQPVQEPMVNQDANLFGGPSMNPVVDNVQPVDTPAVEPVIYGGASPAVGNVNITNNQPHQIYGGADPMENTQPIPSVSQVPVQSAPVVNAAPQIMSQPVVDIPVMNPTVQAPVQGVPAQVQPVNMGQLPPQQ